ncbi:transcriptional regulator, arsr family [hydrocarbon metagenome]|uniref:Transcriptional regulator, arsr family n=1 Tax=hydrocarbon metagenome TaxID=938273 RepID=A0A0W8E3Y7_9ZZZZ
MLIEAIANLFKAMGEPTRLKILKLLSIQEMCVCELVEVLDISQPRVSQHLKVLKNAGVVKERKDKQRTFFSIIPAIDDSFFHLFDLFMTANIADINDLKLESARLAQLDLNENVSQCKNEAI